MTEPSVTARGGSGPVGRRILVVEPMSSGHAILAAARELGLGTVVVSRDQGDRRLPARIRDLIDTLVVLDTNDEDALTDAVVAVHHDGPLCAIMPGFEFYVDSVARLAHRLGLPGLRVEAVDGLRDKALMRAKAAAAGVRVPRNATAASARQLDAAAARVGFPLVVKPTRSAGSVHVSRVDDLTTLRSAYRWMLTDERTDLGRGLDGRVLLEEYVDGPEVSVEGYVAGDDVVIVSVTGKILGPEPTFVEIGHLVEADLSPETRARVVAFVEDVCRALDVTIGPFHCEVRLCGGEPVLIEIGARLAGDHIVDLIEIVTGVSLPRVMLATYAGMELDRVAPPTAPRAKSAGIHFVTAPNLSTFHAAEGVATVRGAPDVLDVEMYLDPGARVPPFEDFRARLGHVIYTADSPAEALARWHRIGEEVRVV